MTTDDNIILLKIRNAVKQTDPDAVAILYGSRATGNANKNSDWDILILLNNQNVTLKDEQRFRHNLYDVELETGEPISTFVYAQIDWNTKLSSTPLHKSVLKNGITL